MKIKLFFMTLLMIVILSPPGRAEDAPGIIVPRVILSFYDSKQHNGEPWFSKTHKFAELPLNHLGLVVRYLDLNAPLPDPATLTDVRGIILWTIADRMDNPIPFAEWITQAVTQGKRLVVLGNPPWSANNQGEPTPFEILEKLWRAFGFQYSEEWISFTHNLEIVQQDPKMIGFEHPLPKVLPEFPQMIPNSSDVRLHLSVRGVNGTQQENSLVATNPRGGYAAPDYLLFTAPDPEEDHEFVQWIVNPFAFFRLSFATDELPKPDASTLSNRRIYYSHIDGDGLRNLTEVRPYKDKEMTAAEVILKEAIEGYPDLPVSVGPVVGDIDPAWYGSKKTIQIARKLLAPPQVEAASHTLSHPLDWSFFDDYREADEVPFLKNYPKKDEFSATNRLLEALGLMKKKPTVSLDTSLWKQIPARVDDPDKKKETKRERYNDYKTPRAYGIKPFNLDAEIRGAKQTIQQVLPSGKKVKLIQWSGNTLPFEQAIRVARLSGMNNINGGDTRFDAKFPSVAWVAPLGRTVGKEWQCYSSASNENTYTSLWTEKFFGFKHLIHTIKNTESPRRLVAFNIYYHFYSGEKQASLNALKENLDYARSQSLAPVAASFYSAIAQGTVEAQIFKLSPGEWSIRNRGQLQTIRFDHGTLLQVDMEKSSGVVGQRHYQGSLYVALDQEILEPRIVIIPYDTPALSPPASVPYLVDGRWQVFGVKRAVDSFEFQAQGFGRGDMTWRVPVGGHFTIETFDAKGRSLNRISRETDGNGGLLRMSLPTSALETVRIVVARQHEQEK
ncbi:MAG: hypothetical protein HQL75_01540 [Magnetococcales bacterium]|nr:hypothetical protein [Magnetococcales bacterium]